eukprot:SAG11_NODE_2191_length_3706_cov_2.096756_3_plen_173_part_00
MIGVNTAIYSPSGASAGIGFAIPIDMVAASVGQLLRHGRIQRPSLGLAIAGDHLLPQLGVRGVSGVLVMRCGQDSGLRATSRDWSGRLVLGDIITAIDGEVVRSQADLFRALEQRSVGQVVTLSVTRTDTIVLADRSERMQQSRHDVKIKLREMPANADAQRSGGTRSVRRR